MKDIKTIWISRLAVVLAVATSATACLKEDILGVAEPVPQGEMIRFDIQRGWDDDEITRSSDNEYGKLLSKHLLVSDDKSQSIEMGAYQQSIDSWFEPETRGTMVQADAFNEFMAFGYKTSGTTTTQMFNTYHQKDGGMWEKPVGAAGGDNENGYYWPGSDWSCSFFGIAMSDNKLTNQNFYNNVTTTTNAAGQIVSFDYTVPEAAVDQPDIMVASATNLPGDGSQGATLDFKHILTAINVKVGATMQNGTIESISFNNIYGKATYNLESGVWSNLREFNELHNYTVDLGEGFATTPSQNGTQINSTGATFMVIPQTLSSSAEIEIRFKHAGAAEAISIKGALTGSSWPQGKVVNYLINVKPDGNLVFTSTVIAQDAHYVIVPLTIKANNLSKGWTMESNSPAVTLKTELTTLQQQGYWTVNELGSQSITSTITGNEVYVYAFLEENVSETNRDFTLTLKNAATGTVVDTKTITQLGMSSARSERIEETSYVPWGFKWDRKVVYHAAPSWSGNSFGAIARNLFAAVLFNSIGQDLVEKYPEAVENGVLTVQPNYTNILFWSMNTSTDIIIDYGKLDNLAGAAADELNGLGNTTDLYYFNGISSISDLETLLDTEKSAFAESAVTKSSDGSLDDTSYITDFAAKSCVMKNKFWAETITEEADGGTVEYQIPVLTSDETASTSDNFNYMTWYLPAANQYADIYQAENNSNYQLNGVYWTSTADANDNLNSYIYTPGTGISLDDRMNTHLVRCMRKQ